MSLNFIVFIFALAGAGLSIFQPVFSIPGFGGVSFLDILMERSLANYSYLGAHGIIIVAIIAVICGLCALLRLTKWQHIAGLVVCSIYLFVRIGTFLSNTNAIVRSFASVSFSYQKTFLLWAVCYSIAAICAYLDNKNLDNLNPSINKEPQAQKIFEPVLGVETPALIKRAFMFIDDNNFDEAERYFEQALRQDPENSSAYFGKLISELKVHNIDELSNVSSALKEQKLFQRALQFADDEDKIKLEHCLELNEKNLETQKQADAEQKYTKALSLKENIGSSFDAQNIIDLLNSITPYKDSEAMIKELEDEKKILEAREKDYMDTLLQKGY